MATEVGRTFSELPSKAKAKVYGRWNYTELETDCPELVNGVRQLLSLEEVKSVPGTVTDVLSVKESSKVPVVSNAQKKQSQNKDVLMPSRFFSGSRKYMERKPLNSTATEYKKPLSHSRRVLFLPDPERIPLNTRDLVPSFDYPSRVERKVTDSTDCGPIWESSYATGPQSAVSFLLTSQSSALKSLYDGPSFSRHAECARFARQSLSTLPMETCNSDARKKTKLSTPRCSSIDISTPCVKFSKSSVPSAFREPKTSSHQLRCSCDEVEPLSHKEISPFQADYWACVIPDSSPPSSDRQSPYWNPNKEYQDLLDYTYPLKPKISTFGDGEQELQLSDSKLQDSGIDIDSFSISPDSTMRSTGTPLFDLYTKRNHDLTENQENYLKETNSQFSSPVFKESATFLPTSCCEPGSATKTPSGKYSVQSKENISTCCTGISPSTKWDLFSLDDTNNVEHGGKSKRKSRNFIPTTQILPCSRESDSDDEYLSLPSRLRELDILAQQLWKASMWVKKPCGDCGGQSSSCNLGTEEALSSQALKGHGGYAVCFDGRNEMQDVPIGGDHWSIYSSPENCSPGTVQDCICEEAEKNLSKFSCLMDRLCAPTPSNTLQSEREIQDHQSGQEMEKSLMQHVQMFCIKLEELIQWLYTVAENTNNWIPPQPDIESVKSSLDVYMDFKKDVVEHQVLTAAVLNTGEGLLKCMTFTSPVLKDTLGLIAKQSEELERHAECWYTSILTAMDTIRDELEIKNPVCQRVNQESKLFRVAKLEESGFVDQELDEKILLPCSSEQ
ncbi:centrosomal protein of 68 kDa [Latimeria chalumnae]|uniref:centrosomal protein of 68 kDa n=1 Tax=Latimeria chalumnae TaxID=7897 RepID=UPI00313EA522